LVLEAICIRQFAGSDFLRRLTTEIIDILTTKPTSVGESTAVIKVSMATVKCSLVILDVSQDC